MKGAWAMVTLTALAAAAALVPASLVAQPVPGPKLPPMPSMEGPPSTGELAKPANAPNPPPPKPAPAAGSSKKDEGKLSTKPGAKDAAPGRHRH